MFVGCTRYCCWYIAVYFKFLAWKALHCTLYHANHLVCRNFSHEWRLTRTLLVLLSISNVQTAVLCLPRICAPVVPSPCADTPAAHLKYSHQKKWHTEPVAQ